jgi:hypothetical protein
LAAAGVVLKRQDVIAVALLLLMPLAWFNQVLVPGWSGKTLLPFDNLYQFEPWHSMRPDVVPYNPLLSDMVVESSVWELHARASFAAREPPLWNPYILAGAPFLADAQGSMLYPLDLLLYPLQLPEAFAWYMVMHISLAGLGMYALGRVLGMRRPSALLAGVAYMFGGALITTATFPQIVGVAAWLPMLLAIAERTIQHAELPRLGQRAGLLWFGGVLAVAMQFLAGHPEVSAYALITAMAYSAARLVVVARRVDPKRVLLAAIHLLSMLVLGTLMASAQLLPTLEAVANNARLGARTAGDLAAVAWPLPQLWTILLPDLFGNPTHRQWLDIWSFTWRSSDQPIFWGTKNYVEAGQYLGVLTLLLAALGVVRGRRRPALIFGALALVTLLLVLGSPLYLVLEALPGFSQLRSPFRWVFSVIVSACVLAGLGFDALLEQPRRARWLAVSALALGLLGLGAVGASLVVPEPFFKLAQRFVTDPAWAQRAFGKAADQLPNILSTPAMFWGYESQGFLRLGLAGLAAGVVLLLARQRQVLTVAAIGLIVLDLYSVHGRFFPASDIALSPLGSGPRPPVIEAIEQRERNGQPWRFTTFERGDEKTFLANGGMYYGWQDARGYDSIVPRWYAQFTRRLGMPIDSLAFNRIAPLYSTAALHSPLLDLLNVKYVLTEQRIDDPGFVQIYRDAHIAAYENLTALPRTFVVPRARVAVPDAQPLDSADPREVVYIESDPGQEVLDGGGLGTSSVRQYRSGRVTLDVNVGGPAWVVLTDSWGPGWHATATSASGSKQELDVYRAYSALRAVKLPSGGRWTIELWYWPMSVTLGIAATVLAVVATAVVVVRSNGLAWAVRRSPSRPLHAPYSPAGRRA